MNKKIKSVLKIGTIILVVIASIVFIKFFTNNTSFSEKEHFVEIPSNANYQEVIKRISPFIKNTSDFEIIAKMRSYTNHVKPGRFLFKNGMNSFSLVSALRHNVPVKLAFNNQERLEDFAGRIGSQIEADSLSLIKVFRDSTFLKQNGFTQDNVFTLFIPNTYELYWNTSAVTFRKKMIDEYHKFWTSERIAKAKANNLTPIEATILASIVHKESVKKDERPRIAGVYLNRIRLGMPLQADPTVIYAVKLMDNNFNQVIKRVSKDYTVLDSPYNTYKYLGLPPGPIAMPDITALEAVLNPDKNNYIYFCASVTHFGYHEYAETNEQHNINRKKYTDWLDAKAITK